MFLLGPPRAPATIGYLRQVFIWHFGKSAVSVLFYYVLFHGVQLQTVQVSRVVLFVEVLDSRSVTSGVVSQSD